MESCQIFIDSIKDKNLRIEGEVTILDNDHTFIGTLIMSGNDIYFVDIYGIEIDFKEIESNN